MATRFSIPAWRIPWTEEPGGLLSMGSHRVRQDGSHLAISASNTQAHTGIAVPGKGLWGGKGAGRAPPGGRVGRLDHRVVLITPLSPLSTSSLSRVKPISNQEVSAHLGPMPPCEGLLSSLIQMLTRKVDAAGHLPGLQSPPRTLKSSCPSWSPKRLPPCPPPRSGWPWSA